MSATRRKPRNLLGSVGIRPDEVGLAIWMSSLFAVTQASHGIGANAADTLFFLRFGVEDLPFMFILSGPAVMISIVGHSAGLAWRGADRWLETIMGISAVWVGALWLSTFAGTTGVYPVIWISTQALIYLTLTVMWNSAGSACTTRQAKRLFPVFATAAIAGGVVGNLLVGPLTALLGADNLLLVQALILVTATLLLRRVSSFYQPEAEERQSVRIEMGRAFDSIRSSRLLRLAAVVVFLLFALFYLVVFPFSEVVTSTFPDETRLAGFLGVFSSIATATTFLFSLLFTGRLFSRLGLVMTLLTVPIVYLLGFSGWLIAFGVVSATIFRGVQWVAVNSVQTTGYSALFNVLSSGRRGPVMALMTAVPAQLGTMSAGVILIASSMLPAAGLFTIGAVMAAIAVAAVAAMRPAYLSAVVEAVRRGLVTLWDAPQSGLIAAPVDRDVVRVLEAHLSDSRPRARAIAAAGLGQLGDDAAIGGVQALLDDDEPMVRAAAFQAVCQIEPTSLEPRLVSALEDESAEVRLNAIHYIGSTGAREIPVPVFARVVEDPDPRVRAAGAWLAPGDAGRAVVDDLVSSNDKPSLRAVLNEMTRHPKETLGLRPLDHIDDEDATVRSAAVVAAATSGADPERLAQALEDRSVRVRRAAATSLASTEAGRTLLYDVLDQGSVLATEAALDALTPMKSLEPRFTEWAAREAQRAAFLAEGRRSLEPRLESRHGRYLVRVIDGRVDRLVRWVLMAMTTAETKDMMSLVTRGIEADDAETKAQAIEALETLGDRSVLTVLLPLLDQTPAEESEGASHDALEALADDFDPWLSALASRCLHHDITTGAVASSGEMTDDHVDTLDEMGRVLALQRVPMFSELDPEDLALVSRFAEEVHFNPEESVYREGETGTELLVIVDGSAVVSRTREGSRRLINTYREPDHVGELSLLTGSRRSADVDAGDDGLHGLVLRKQELIAILDERPAVAVGMLGTLAARLIEQT